MKILYVTGLWRGLRTILYEGQTEEMGMPAFMKPLKKLLKDGNEVDIFLIHKFDEYPKYNINVSWISEKNIIDTFKWDLSFKGRFLNDLNVYLKTKALIKLKDYDIVYGHGDTSPAAAWAARKMGVPYGQRIYGSFLDSYIKKYGKFLGTNRLIHDKWMFKNKQDFVLITNDGTRGDVTYRIINKHKKRSDMYFWVNGVDAMPEIDKETIEKLRTKGVKFDEPFLFYFARFEEAKGQINGVELLKKLVEKGLDIKIVFAGQFSVPSYVNKVKELLSSYSLQDKAVFLGQIDRAEISVLAKKASASVFFYYASNMGNCFHEVFRAGGVVVSFNDGSLDDYIVNRENGFLVDSITEAAEIIENMAENKIDTEGIRREAIKSSNALMKTWDARVDDEMELLKKYVRKQPNTI